jgi:sialate O-acetylesterase
LNTLKNDYGRADIVCSGPVFSSVEFIGAREGRDGRRGNAGRAVVTMETFGSKLVTDDKYGYVRGFAVAGADKVFHWAQARIGRDGRVTVYSAAVDNPVAVRYAWSNNPLASLFNSEGLPAAPFRTDDWPGITK